MRDETLGRMLYYYRVREEEMDRWRELIVKGEVGFIFISLVSLSECMEEEKRDTAVWCSRASTFRLHKLRGVACMSWDLRWTQVEWCRTRAADGRIRKKEVWLGMCDRMREQRRRADFRSRWWNRRGWGVRQKKRCGRATSWITLIML